MGRRYQRPRLGHVQQYRINVRLLKPLVLRVPHKELAECIEPVLCDICPGIGAELRPPLVGIHPAVRPHEVGENRGQRAGTGPGLNHPRAGKHCGRQEHRPDVLGIDDGGGAFDLHRQVRKTGLEQIE